MLLPSTLSKMTQFDLPQTGSQQYIEKQRKYSQQVELQNREQEQAKISRHNRNHASYSTKHPKEPDALSIKPKVD